MIAGIAQPRRPVTAFPRLRAAGPGLEGIAGAPYLVFYGEVSADSDGPVELCRPLAADPGPAPGGDVQFRAELAHDEAWIRLAEREMSWPRMMPFAEALEQWGRDHGRAGAAPLRQVLIADRRTAAPDTPVCDLSLPLR